ncbi:lipid II flippase MurJ, partial [Okeania sp. SIO2G5]|uniref:lipid II flippase MurJ n=1 Tax=Okeania sp. SIO2G5 TaxID=2607796 RepID=UPI0013C0BB5D
AVSSARAQLFVLSVLSSEATLGLYGSVLQLVQPFAIISNSVVSTTFPSMSRATKQGKGSQKKVTEFSVMILMAVAIPCVIGAFFLGKDLLQFVYGDAQFRSASVAFIVVSFSLLSESFIRPFSYLMVANHMENINLREVFITGFFSILLSIVLIPKYQLMGAAYSFLIVQIIALVQYGYALCNKLFIPNIIRMLGVPLILGSLMAIVFLIINKGSLEFSAALTVATLSYLLFSGITFAWMSGRLSKYVG